MSRTAIQTISGEWIDFSNPVPEVMHLEDIAHAIALENRYSGHTPFPYSVAQHSVLCSLVCPPDLAYQCLFHDAHEAYVGDLPTPLKGICPTYRDIEHRFERALRHKFGLPNELDPAVKVVDRCMLKTEAQQFGFSWIKWPEFEGLQAFDIQIIEWPWKTAKARFLARARELARR